MKKMEIQKNNEKILKPIFVNAGVEAKYRKELQALIKEMANSYAYWLRADLRPMAMDADVTIPIYLTNKLKKTLDELANKWESKFNKISTYTAKRFIDGSRGHVEQSLMKSLEQQGFAIKFKPTMPVMSAAKLSLNENVGLIRTIPKLFHSQVEGDVWRMVQSGFDLQKLTNTIEDRYKKTHWRASFIAKDQSSKVKAVMEKERQLELGITEAIWQHSHAGHEPRPSHVAAGRDKLRFDIRKGAYLESNGNNPDGSKKWEWQLPGGLALNCRCTSRSIIKEFGDI